MTDCEENGIALHGKPITELRSITDTHRLRHI